jgi:endonuclease YncB( thermonuclease family)
MADLATKGAADRLRWPAASRVILGASLAAWLALALLFSAAAHAQQRAEVIDGDTIRVAGQVVRIMGLDAPEMRGRCPRERQLAQRAQARMTQLVARGVVLERHGLDRWRRQLAVVRDRTGRDLAWVMIAEGLARPYDGRGPRGSWCDG